MKKTLVWSLMWVFLILFSACGSSEEEAKIEVGEGLAIQETETGFIVMTTAEMRAAEVDIMGDIVSTDIESSSDYLPVIQNKEDGVKVALAFLGEKTDIVSFTVRNTSKNLVIKCVDTVVGTESKTVKSAGGEKLLGDYNDDKEVGLSDFNTLKQNFGLSSSTYDIGPASKGTGDWAGIYCVLSGDGKISLEDLAVFATNFGKKEPTENPDVEVTSVELSISNTDMKVGDSQSATVTINPSNATDKTIDWEVSNSAVVKLTVVPGATVATLTAQSAGSATVTVSSTNGKTSSKTINVTKEEIKGIKVHAKYKNIWAWNKNGESGSVFSSWPGEAMTEETNGWYMYYFEDGISLSLLFNNNDNDKTGDLSISEEGEYWYDGTKLVTSNPDQDTTAPELSIIPAAKKEEAGVLYYEEESVNITLEITDDQDSNPKGYYTTDGSTAGSTDKLYANESISVSDGMKISVYTVDADGNNAVYSYSFKLGVDGTKPEITSNPAAGRYDEGSVLNVKLTATDNKDNSPNIYYTTDGSTPKEELSYLYNGGTITVSQTTTIKTLVVDASGNSTQKNFSYYIGSVSRNDFRQETIYFVMTTRFYDGDSTNNVNCWDEASWFNNPESDPSWRGDFKGLIEKLDYIKALGFTAIWITPPVKNASGIDYHGYHAVDFTEIDPRYDTNGNGSAMDEYQELIDEVHARGMKIIQDIVINHTGNFGEENLFPLFEMDSSIGANGGYANLEDPELIIANSHLNAVANSYYGDNYADLIPARQYGSRINAMKEDDTDVNKIYHHEKSMSYESYTEQIGQMAGDCVDLNTENPDVAKYLREAYNTYIDMGVDGFRIDTVKHVSRLSFNKEYIPYWNERGGENFYMFGEVCTRVREVWNKGIAADSAPFYTWKESKTYPWGDEATNSASVRQLWDDNADTTGQPESNNAFLSGNTYHEPDYSMNSGLGVIDFAMHWNFYEARNAFSVALGGDKYYNDATWNVVYVDSHDYSPDECQKFRFNAGTDAWAENLSLMFTFRGIPCVYYGSEIEFQKGKPIDPSDGDFRVPFTESGRAYYGEHLEGTITATDFGTYQASGTVKDTLEQPLSKHIRTLNKIRREVPALQMGQYSTDGCDGSFAFKRRYTKDGVDSMVLVSISGGATFTGVPSGRWVDVITGDVQTGSTVTSSASGKGNLRVYVLDGEKIEGLDSPFID